VQSKYTNSGQLKSAIELANRRGTKSITVADLIFLIRHDKSKVSRLKTFLSWKDVRKNVKDSDDKAGGGDAGDIDLEGEGAQAPAAGGPTQKSNKKQKLILPWDVEFMFSIQVPEREDEEDEEEEEQNEATMARLASADERTKNMTKEEYVYWSDCRQASFTFRKGKRFREWAGFGTVVDTKPNDDVIDILGFLTFEIVQTLTETALKVKAEQDLANRKSSQGQQGEGGSKKRKREGLFEMPEEGRTPVEPQHVREAFRRLQIPPKKYTFFQQGYAGMRRPYRLI
jgi:transcription initiation protein SPT3